MLDNKTYYIIKIDDDYFMVEDIAIKSDKHAAKDDYEIRFESARPVLKRVIFWGDLFGYKVLAASRKIGLPLIDKSLFEIPSTVGVEPASVEVSHVLMEDLSYPMKKQNGYVKINKVNY